MGAAVVAGAAVAAGTTGVVRVLAGCAEVAAAGGCVAACEAGIAVGAESVAWRGGVSNLICARVSGPRRYDIAQRV